MGKTSTIFTDNFNRADNTDLGSVWDVNSTQIRFGIVSNTAQPSTLSVGDCQETYNGATMPDDQWAEGLLTMTGTVAGHGPGLVLRASSTVNTFYRLDCNHAASGNIRIAKNVAGVFTSLATFTSAWTNGDKFTFAIAGYKLSVFKNDVLIGSVTDGGSSIASGKVGIFNAALSETAPVSIDDFACGAWTVAYTLTANAGAFAIAGTAAGLRAGRRLGALPGAYTLVGVNAILKAGRRLGALSGSYVITGTPVDFVYTPAPPGPAPPPPNNPYLRNIIPTPPISLDEGFWVKEFVDPREPWNQGKGGNKR